MYYAFTPDSGFKSFLPNGSEPTWQTVMLYSDIVPLIYVNETICMVICPSTRFKLIILWPGWIIWCQDYPKMYLMGEGPGAILSFKTFLSFINRLLVTIQFFLWSCMDVRVGLWRLSAEELMLLNCGIGESLGLQGDPTSPFWSRSVLGVLWKEWC